MHVISKYIGWALPLPVFVLIRVRAVGGVRVPASLVVVCLTCLSHLFVSPSSARVLAQNKTILAEVFEANTTLLTTLVTKCVVGFLELCW